jgi:solute carrier family 15 (peptide/histidine transporter), member 3/4
MSTNLVNFMKNRLNEGNTAAANNVTNWSGTCYITPLIGAFLADAYLGRFSTISTFMLIYIVVSTLVTVLEFSVAVIGVVYAVMLFLLKESFS